MEQLIATIVKLERLRVQQRNLQVAVLRVEGALEALLALSDYADVAELNAAIREDRGGIATRLAELLASGPDDNGRENVVSPSRDEMLL